MKKLFKYPTIFLATFSIQLVHSPSLIITSSGLYQLGDNIEFTPSGADSIISIAASNVDLDLNQRFITQSNLTADVNGINVSSGFSNIHIRNGTISNITGTGILVNSGCSRVFIDDIVTFSCDMCGINLAGIVTSSILDTYINRTEILGCCQANSPSNSSTSALSLQYCARLNLQNINVNGCGNTSDSLSAIVLNTVSKSRFSYFDVTANIAASTYFRGFDMSATYDCEFYKCAVKENSSSTVGMTFSAFNFQSTSVTCTSNIFKECIVMDHTLADSTTTFTGFNLLANNSSNYFEKCMVMQNTSGSGMVGFGMLSTMNNYLYRCIAENNNSTANSAIGCFISTSTSTKLVDCVSADHDGTLVIGFSILSCTSPMLIRCVSDNNIGTSSATGMRFNGCTGSVVQDNIASKNVGPTAATSFGFVLEQDSATILSAFMRNTALNNGATVGNGFSGLAGNNATSVGTTNTNAVTAPWSNISIVP